LIFQPLACPGPNGSGRAFEDCLMAKNSKTLSLTITKEGLIFMPDFRTQIKDLLKKKKMSVPQLARKVGLNQQTIYNYLAGRSQMFSGNLEQILKVLQF